MWENETWLVSVGPNPGRGSTHAHGPVTPNGPVKTIPAERVAGILSEVAEVLRNGDHLSRTMMAAALDLHALDLND